MIYILYRRSRESDEILHSRRLLAAAALVYSGRFTQPQLGQPYLLWSLHELNPPQMQPLLSTGASNCDRHICRLFQLLWHSNRMLARPVLSTCSASALGAGHRTGGCESCMPDKSRPVAGRLTLLKMDVGGGACIFHIIVWSSFWGG